MRNTAFLMAGIVLVVLQSNLFQWIDRLPGVGASPNLLLSLIIFMGVHEYSIFRGAALTFVLGYFFDLISGSPTGLFTFISTAVFVVARAAGVRMAARTFFAKVALAFVFAMVEGSLVVILTAIFGTDPAKSRALIRLIVPHAIATAIVAPAIFYLAERIHQATILVPRPGDGGNR